MAQTIATSDRAGGSANALAASLRSAAVRSVRSLSAGIHQLRDRLDSSIVTEIDVDKVATELDIEARGAKDGAIGQPPPLEAEATGTQREVVAHFRSLQRRAQKRAAAATERLHELENKVDIQRVISEIREVPARCEAELVRFTSRIQPDIDEAREQAARAAALLIDDKKDGSVAAPASHNSSLKYSLLAVLVIFGAASLVTGLVSGAATSPADWALAIAALTVLAPFVLAREIARQVDNERREHRVMAAFGTVLSVFFVILLAAVSAAMISAKLAGGDPGVQDVLNALATPTAGVDLAPQGWVGAIAVIVAGMLSIGLGRNSAEAVPVKRLSTMPKPGPSDSMQGIVSRTHKQYNRIIDQAEKKITVEGERVRKRVRQFRRALDDSKSIPAQVEDYCVALEDACNIVLDRYRTANRECRTLDDPPSFTAHVCFRPEDNAYAAAFEAAEARREAFEQALVELERESTKARQKLRDLNSRVLSFDGADLKSSSGLDDGPI